MDSVYEVRALQAWDDEKSCWKVALETSIDNKVYGYELAVEGRVAIPFAIMKMHEVFEWGLPHAEDIREVKREG